MGNTEEMTIDEAVSILDAYLHDRYKSIYLFDAWERIKMEVNQND